MSCHSQKFRCSCWNPNGVNDLLYAPLLNIPAWNRSVCAIKLLPHEGTVRVTPDCAPLRVRHAHFDHFVFLCLGTRGQLLDEAVVLLHVLRRVPDDDHLRVVHHREASQRVQQGPRPRLPDEAEGRAGHLRRRSLAAKLSRVGPEDGWQRSVSLFVVAGGQQQVSAEVEAICFTLVRNHLLRYAEQLRLRVRVGRELDLAARF